MPLSPCFEQTGFDAVPNWSGDDHRAAFVAFRRCAARAVQKRYKTGALGVSAEAFADIFAEARDLTLASAAEAREFFEARFAPCRINPGNRNTGFVTGYYEPVVTASRTRTADFKYPILARPDDLVDIDHTNRPAAMDPYFAFARKTSDGLAAFHDRAAIEQGALQDRGLEIAWLADPVEVFFIHVQGAARLQFADGQELRITYAAKTGHPFTGPGGVLAAMGEIPRDDVTMQTIKAWFAANPDRVNEILFKNRSFIFFREAPVDEHVLGPVAAAKVPLTPGRSLAVDRLLHTFGTPFFIHAPELTVFDGGPFSRLMIAQDTGSAITGPARGDLFAGTGPAAGEIAGVIKHDAEFFALVPRKLVTDRAYSV